MIALLYLFDGNEYCGWYAITCSVANCCDRTCDIANYCNRTCDIANYCDNIATNVYWKLTFSFVSSLDERRWVAEYHLFVHLSLVNIGHNVVKTNLVLLLQNNIEFYLFVDCGLYSAFNVLPVHYSLHQVWHFTDFELDSRVKTSNFISRLFCSLLIAKSVRWLEL